jgi:hypothetical protein
LNIRDSVRREVLQSEDVKYPPYGGCDVRKMS